MTTMTSREIASFINKSHASIRNRITNRLKRHPKLLAPLFTISAFVNDDARAELEYTLDDDGINYICAEFGADGKALRQALTLSHKEMA